MNKLEDSFTIRLPYNTLESISKILYYQNEQLLFEIAKSKGWNSEEIIKKYLIDNQNRIEVVNETIDIKNDKVIKLDKYDINDNICCARTQKGINSRCSIKKKKG